MKIKARAGNEDIATVYIAEPDKGGVIEFVESIQPPLPIEKKWVLIVSTLCGCPVDCTFCDAGGSFRRKLTEEEIFSQIDYMVLKKFPDRIIRTEKFKIQFARIGEPSFNPAVLGVLEKFYSRYEAENFIPSVSTIAPRGTEKFFDKLLEIKKRLYTDNFQMQFSLHTTDIKRRDRMIPVEKWSFGEIADYSERFFTKGGRKITLNFALEESSPVEAGVLKEYFSPEIFLLKFTPLNPTAKVIRNNYKSYIKPGVEKFGLIEKLNSYGYETLVSIGELEENRIGSNCGQYISTAREPAETSEESYTYKINEVNS